MLGEGGGHMGEEYDLGRGRTDKTATDAPLSVSVPGGHSITIQKINSSGIDKTETRPNNYAFIAYIKS
jgi:hypothetical protein